MSNDEIAKTMINNLVTTKKFQTLFQKFSSTKCFNTLNLLNIFVADTLFENTNKLTPFFYKDFFEFSFFDEKGNKFLVYKVQGFDLDVFAYDTKIIFCRYNNDNKFKNVAKLKVVKNLLSRAKERVESRISKKLDFQKNVAEDYNKCDSFWTDEITSRDNVNNFSFYSRVWWSFDGKYLEYGGVSIETTRKRQVDIPTKTDVKKIIKNWYKNGQNIEAILELNKFDPALHADYLKLKKNSYYLYNGLKPQLTADEYEVLKFNTMTKIVKWAKENYDNGTPVMSDIFYDKCVSNIFILTYISERTFLPKVSYNEEEVVAELEHEDSSFSVESEFFDRFGNIINPPNTGGSPGEGIPPDSPTSGRQNTFTMETDSDWQNSTSKQIWDKCYSFYSIDNLKKYNPKLNDEYIEIKKRRFMYNRNFRLSDNAISSTSITDEKSRIYDRIVKWSERRWTKGQKTFSSAKYDRIKQRIYEKSKPKFGNVNINNISV